MPNNIGDIADAIEYTGSPFKLYASYDYFDDSLFDISNKVHYGTEKADARIMNKDEYDHLFEQYYDNGEKFPSRSDLDRRVRFGELIYVENYTRSDGTKVSGYYRRFPQK